MKGKKGNYILIGLIILLWVAIYFRYSAGSSDDSGAFVPQKKQVIQSNTHEIPSSFTVLVNYRDPFSGKLKSKTNNNRNLKVESSRSLKSLKQVKEPEAIVDWPSLDYKGLVYSNSKKVGVLSFNGADKLVVIGDSLYGLFIQDIAEDSLILNFKGEYKSVY